MCKFRFAGALAVAILLAGVVAGTLFAAGAQEETDEVTTISFPHFKVSEGNVARPWYTAMVDRFNEKYEGQYRVDVDPIAQTEYADLIMLLERQGELPPFISGGAGNDFIEDVLIAENLLHDLRPWLDEHPEIEAYTIDSLLAFNTTDDGRLVSMPMHKIEPLGMFYNEEIFAEAGVSTDIGSMDLDEFEEAMEAIKAAGYPPLAMNSDASAFFTTMTFSFILANQPGGADLLETAMLEGTNVYDYTDPIWVDSFARIERWLRDYSQPGAAGATGPEAVQAFVSGSAAMIPNGPWFIGQILNNEHALEGLQDIVGMTLFPGRMAMNNAQWYGDMVAADLPEDELEAVLAFLAHKHSPEELAANIVSLGGINPDLDIDLSAVEGDIHPIIRGMNEDFYESVERTPPNAYLAVPIDVLNEFGRHLPRLADGSVSPQRFADELTRYASQFE